MAISGSRRPRGLLELPGLSGLPGPPGVAQGSRLACLGCSPLGLFGAQGPDLDCRSLWLWGSSLGCLGYSPVTLWGSEARSGLPVALGLVVLLMSFAFLFVMMVTVADPRLLVGLVVRGPLGVGRVWVVGSLG